jgi:hypothetical protein
VTESLRNNFTLNLWLSPLYMLVLCLIRSDMINGLLHNSRNIVF